MQGASFAQKETIWKESIALSLAMYSGWYYLRRSLPGRAQAEAPGRSEAAIRARPISPGKWERLGAFLVLAGDLLKTAAACWLCAALFPELGRLVYLWAGLGATLGHNFPVWAGFRGGKGVATTCAFLFLFSPLWCGSCIVLGGVVVLATGYLPVAAVVITTAALLPAWHFGALEGFALVLAADVLMIQRHHRGIARALRVRNTGRCAEKRRGKSERGAMCRKFTICLHLYALGRFTFARCNDKITITGT